MGDFLLEHLEELAFLHVQRRALLFSPDTPLTGLKRHDDRIRAHQDGLRCGASAAAELARSRFGSFDPWDVFAAVWTWCLNSEPTAEDWLEAAEAADEEQMPAWGEAWRLLDPQRLKQLLPADVTVDFPPPVQAPLLFARCWHGLQDPAELAAWVESPEIAVRRSLARALGWGIVDTDAAARWIEPLVADECPEVARAALWSAVLLGSDEAVEFCRDEMLAGRVDPFRLRVLGLRGRGRDVKPLVDLLTDPEHGAEAAHALGWLGFPVAVPALIDALDEDDSEAEDSAPAQALTRIVGELPETESPEDPDAEPVHWPDHLREWWDRRSDGTETQRWLRGRQRGEAVAEPTMEALWLDALDRDTPESKWLKFEVPAGFFDPEMEPEVLPGV